MSERRGVLAAGATVLAAVLVLAVLWATEDRLFTASVPQPPPLDRTAVVELAGGERACLENIVLVPESEVAQFRVGTRGRPPVPLSVTAAGSGGYRATGRVPRDWTDNDLVDVRFEAPDEPVRGRFCIRNEGRRTIDLYAADDRALTVARTTVDGGAPEEANVQLAFLEAEPVPIADRAGQIVRELSVFRPGIVGPGSLWPLAVLLVAGLPLGLALAMWRAVRDDAAPPPPPPPR